MGVGSKEGVENVLHMKGGTGHESYHEFSRTLQSCLNEFYWPRLSDAIASKLNIIRGGASNSWTATAIADFGCSCAWSTINSTCFTVRCLRGLFAANSLPQPFIQAFFNDLPSNDFNTLFRNLSSLPRPALDFSSEESRKNDENPTLDFLPCGVPGSFYSRIFPPSYLHTALCTLALHNLSRVPEAVQDRNSPAWNEGGIWLLQGCKPETVQEYKKQFQKDFGQFLQYRSEELVSGGLLFCVMIASKERPPYTRMQTGLQTNLQIAWKELVSDGLLHKDSMDTFNLPLFFPTVDEVREAVTSCGAFHIVELEYNDVEISPEHVWNATAAADSHAWGNTCVTMVRNFMGSLIEAHLGLEKFELILERFRQVAAAAHYESSRSRFLGVIVLALART